MSNQSNLTRFSFLEKVYEANDEFYRGFAREVNDNGDSINC